MSQVMLGGRHADLRGLALKGLFERDFHIVAQICAALAATADLRATTAHHLAEDSSKMSDKPKRSHGRRCRRRQARHAAIFEGRMAEPVIGCALLRSFSVS
jgi:hypothetical protein